MPNIKSAIRRVKKSRKQALINRIRKSKYKSAVKQMSMYLTAGKISEAKKFLPGERIEIITNGDVLNTTRIKKLIDAGLTTLSISAYDGPDQAAKFQEENHSLAAITNKNLNRKILN